MPPQYTTIRVYDEKTKDPMELAIIELYEGPFIVGELFTDNSGCVTINDNNCDSVRIKFIEHNAITVCDPIKYNTINVYMTQKYDWWIKEWKIVSKRKIKQLGTTGNVFIKQNN